MIRDLERARTNCIFFAKHFLPGTFNREFDNQKSSIVKLYEDQTIPFCAAMGRVGMGKTSIFHAYSAREICFHQMPFLLWVGGNKDLASDETEILKTHLQSKMLRDVFGKVLIAKIEDGTRVGTGIKAWAIRDPFTKEVFANVVPKGTQQGMRGIGRLASGRRWRMTAGFLDDPEADEKLLSTLTSREKTRTWFNGTFVGRVDTDFQPVSSGPMEGRWMPDPGDPYWRPAWRIYVSSNYMHDDAMIQYLIEDSRFVSIKLPLAEKREDNQWHSCVEIFSDEDVRSRIRQAEKQPQAKTAFWRDQLLVTEVGDPTRYWGGHTFQYYEEPDESLLSDRIYRAIIGDPTKTNKPQSDPAALLAVAVDPSAAKIYFMDYHQTKDVEEKNPTVFAEKLLEFAIEYDAWSFAIELVLSDVWIRTLMESVLDARGHGGDYRWVKLDVTTSGTGITEGEFGSIKARRAYAGAQLFRPTKPTHPNGHVWLAPRLKNSPLISAFKACPNNKVSCGTDCAGYVPQLMRAEGIHWENQALQTADDVKKSRQCGDRLRSYLNRRLGAVA